MVIETDGLTKRYGSLIAVEDVSVSVARGEVVGFVGLNGAGKSTTINLLLGFLRPSKGEVRLFGEPVQPESAHRSHRRIGFASGDMSLFTNFTGQQYLDFLARTHKLRDDRRLKELCGLFEPQLNKRLGTLSRGNKQKVALIAAFKASPELVVLDEPSSGLDPLMQQAFLDLVREEGERGTTIFMSSHYLNEVADVCSRVLFMRAGKIVEDVTAEQLAQMGGKLVTVVSKQELTPPKAADTVRRQEDKAGHTLVFVYKGPPVKLQQWLAGQTMLIDFSVANHDPEAVFSELYTGKKPGGSHV